LSKIFEKLVFVLFYSEEATDQMAVASLFNLESL